MNELLGNLLRIENVRSIDRWELAFAAAWAQRHPEWVLVGCAAAIAAAIWFYRRFQPTLSRPRRAALSALRSALLALLVVLLADPVLQVTVDHVSRPLLWLLVDGSESMTLEDDLPADERTRLAAATGLAASGNAAPTRVDYLKAWLGRPEENVVKRLAEKFRIRAFLFDGPESVKPLELEDEGRGSVDPARAAAALTTRGEVTAIGAALRDLRARHTASSLQGLVVISDFDENSGPPAVEAAERLGVPCFTIGLGPAIAVDIATDLQSPPVMKKGEATSVTVLVRQSGLVSATVAIAVTARRVDGSVPGPEIPIGARSATLDGPTASVEIPFTPAEVGRFEFTATVEPQPGESVAGNNVSSREVNIRDDFLRLMYVADEPGWEWRFVKEVFHRDPLVGERGFRTYLRSADARVRRENPLYLETATPPRGEFFANDVLFIGNFDARAMSGRFAEMAREFVETFGGGMVVLGSRWNGPEQFLGTPLGDMLPVVPTDGAVAAVKPFRPRLTAEAPLFEFMRLGRDEADSARAWAKLDPLPWYQPVERPHPQATVLLAHPTDRCSDGRTPQPLIAIRRYGRGEVVYLAFDEMWRMRKGVGDRYYRQFWGQLIYRLGLSHALGSSKRFVVRSDADRYQPGDAAVITVEAYDKDFRPLEADDLPGRALAGELVSPEAQRGEQRPQAVALQQLREGVFEARVDLGDAGEYRMRVTDPLTGESTEAAFRVDSLSAEKRSVVRNTALAGMLASRTGGRAYDLASAARLPDEIDAVARPERSVKVFPLSNTWLCFLTVVGLMLGEWLLRKRSNLT
jgi:hypothetical protein